MTDITTLINNTNVMNINTQINKKKGFEPYYATIEHSVQVLTDYDVFPYPRWYRGIPTSSEPIVAEREAGWRIRHDDYYHPVCEPETPIPYPNHCFQGPCSLVLPCYEKQESCIPHYR